MAAPTVSYNLVQFSSAIVNAFNAGALVLDLIKILCTTTQNLTNGTMLGACVALCVSILIDAHVRFIADPFTRGSADLFSGWLQMAGVWMTLFLLVKRARAYHYADRKLQVVTNSLAALLLIVTFVVRLINTVNDAAAINGAKEPISADARQAMRIILNTTACVTALYFETYITFAINRATAGAANGKNISKGYRNHIFALSTYISLIFLTQALLQFLRLVGVTTFAPFYGFGWSIVLKRIVEFKEEYSENMRSFRNSDSVTMQGGLKRVSEKMNVSNGALKSGNDRPL